MSTTGAAVSVKRGQVHRSGGGGVVYRQRLVHQAAELEFLDCGEFSLAPGCATQTFSFPGRESLLYLWKGFAAVTTGGREYTLSGYDMLYVPLGAAFSIANLGADPAAVLVTSAPAENVHPAHHARFREVASREDRIRRLKGKDVYMMFDVGEAADKLVAGYTFFQPFQRSWPPHNHTDQEEVYIFIKGRGAMEVYESPETLSFVVEVGEGDIVSIPMLNYHPVFSQAEPLEFIWCLAGARYWVGDKSKAFMQGTAEAVTT
jgi:mannose-6-phosphate isomerase-like protein (cupin superfamily)